MALKLLKSGHEIFILLGDGEDNEFIYDDQFKYIFLPIKRRGTLLDGVKSLFLIRRFFKKNKFDVVNVHTPLAAYYLRLSTIFNLKPKIIYTVHGFYFHEEMRIHSYLLHLTSELFLSFLTDKFIFVSNEDLVNFNKRLFGLRRADLFYAPNTVDPVKYSFKLEVREKLRLSFNLNGDDLVVGMVCRFNKEKGVFEFLQAAKELLLLEPRFKFILVGDFLEEKKGSPFHITFQNMIADLDGRIILTGFVDNVHDVLSIFDIFCLPSYREGYPYSLLEAMANGCTSVATSIRGCREIAKKGNNIFLVPPKNVIELRDCLLGISEDYKFDESLRVKISMQNGLIFSKPNCHDVQHDIIVQ